MHKLQICAIESFGKAFEMSRESQSYFECFYLAVLAGTKVFVSRMYTNVCLYFPTSITYVHNWGEPKLAPQ